MITNAHLDFMVMHLEYPINVIKIKIASVIYVLIMIMNCHKKFKEIHQNLNHIFQDLLNSKF